MGPVRRPGAGQARCYDIADFLCCSTGGTAGAWSAAATETFVATATAIRRAWALGSYSGELLRLIPARRCTR